MPTYFNPAKSTKGELEGMASLEYINEMLSRSLLIPGVTCQIDYMSKQKTKTYRTVTAAPAEDLELFADATSEGKSVAKDIDITINKRWSATVAGEFMPNFTDAEFDSAVWNDVQEQLIDRQNTSYLNFIKTNAGAIEVEKLDKTNVLDSLIDVKKEYKKINPKASLVTIMINSEVESLIDKSLLTIPNANAISVQVEATRVLGQYKGMLLVAAPELDDKAMEAVLVDPTKVRLLLINPVKQCAIPGFGDDVLNGFIVRVDKPHKNITTETVISMPYGLGTTRAEAIAKVTEKVGG